METRIRRFVPVALAIALLSAAHAQERFQVALWPEGAKGAYSLTLDDYCGDWARGVGETADAIARAEGVRFGFSIIVGQCGRAQWEKARSMAEWGHEPLNHSWSHTCPTEEDWCVASSQRRHWTDLALELDSSTAAIERNVGIRPVTFAFPFDRWLPEQRAALERLGYVADRSGQGGRVNDDEPDLPAHYSADALFPKDDPGRLRFQSFSLDSLPKHVAARGGWATRTMHGVADASWGSLDADEFAAHVRLMSRLRRERQVWSAPPGDVVLYAAMRDRVRFGKAAPGGAHGGMLVKYENELDSLAALRPSLRLSVEVAGRGVKRAWQGDAPAKTVCEGRYCWVEVSPRSGEFELEFE